MPTRPVTEADAAAICSIYNHYIRSSFATFEETDLSARDMRQRILDVTKNYPWLVMEDENRITGYAYATRWKERASYRYSVEITAYVADGLQGKGFGKALYIALLPRLEAQGLHAVMAGIALPNPASVALHEACGFRKVAHLQDIGCKHGKWIDVGYWQLLLPRTG
jgi:L-amino acid N-acyltransferase YncA